jgi:hypothetical protein
LPSLFKAPWPQATTHDAFPFEIVPFDWGWEPVLTPQYRAPWPQATNPDVLPSVLTGTWGWDPVLPSLFKAPWPQATTHDAFPFEIVPFDWGWEPVLPPQYHAPWPQASNPDVLPSVLTGTWGWDPTLPRPSSAPYPRASIVEVFPNEIVAFGWGWEHVLTPQYRPWPQATNPDVLPSVLTGTWGWDPILPRPFKAPWPQATINDVFPTMRMMAYWGWETISSSPFQPQRIQASNADTFPPMILGLWGFEPIVPLPSKIARSREAWIDALPKILSGTWGWEASPSRHVMIPSANLPFDDIFPRPSTILIYPWVPDFFPCQAPQIRHPSSGLDDWWPSLPYRPYPGAYKPWYGWDDIYYEDDDLRQRLEREISRLDQELDALALEELEALEDEEREARHSRDRHVITPEVLPPGWRRDKQQGDRWTEPGVQDPDLFRHVHYNFSSDLDLGIRRRIVGILIRAERREARIYGSEAFKTSETALVRGRVIEQGTHAWIVKLSKEERLAIAREAVREGFKLISFDATSLSFIHEMPFPWKPLLIGVGAGLFAGWLIWERNPKKRR